MKRILIPLVLVLTQSAAIADTCSAALVPLFTSYQATKLCQTFVGDETVSASLVPGSDNAYDLGTALKQFRSIYLGTNIILGAASAKIIPGATSLLIRNNADSATNLGITDAGVVTTRAGLTNTAGATTNSAAADFVVATSGGTLSLQEATAGAACSGTLTANGATPVVTSTTCATTGSRIFLTRTSAETGVVSAWRSALSNGVSFSITGEAGDTGSYDWFIVHEAP